VTSHLLDGRTSQHYVQPVISPANLKYRHAH
jgi:hypothetical protein